MALKILLADDSLTAQNTGKKILTSAGYDVVTVSNGVAALKKIAELHPDIVLLDVYMAGYTGVEVCAKTKADAATAQLPILLTVGMMESFDAAEATQVKAEGLIIKPFDVTNLITAVEKLAERLRPPEPAPPLPASAVPERPQPTPAASLVQAPHQQTGEVCDVCGHVNQDGATVCGQCDVPLPSSVAKTGVPASIWW
jgi:CheY-like chemotaxis protein